MKKSITIAAVIATTLAALSVSGQAQTPSRFPMTITNCGIKTTFTKMPERVVSLYSVTTELLLRLGLGDKIVAAANFGEAMPSDLEGAYKKLNLIGKDFIIPKEVLLTQRPDFVMDNQPDYFYDAAQGFATRAEIKAAGAQTYTISAKCENRASKGSLEDIYTDLRNIGRIFDVSAKADAVIREMSKKVAEVRTRVAGRKPLKVMIYDAGEGPLGVFGPGSYDYVLRLAGGENAFADLKLNYEQVSVESVATREIDVVIVSEYDDKTAARIAFIKKTFPNLKAVKNNRVLSVPYGLMNPGVRNHLGVEAFAKAIFPDAFARK